MSSSIPPFYSSLSFPIPSLSSYISWGDRGLNTGPVYNITGA